MFKKDRPLLGQLLIDLGKITEDQLGKGLIEQKKLRQPLGSTLVKLGFITEEEILKALAHQLDLPYVKLQDNNIDPQVIKKIPSRFVCYYKFVPLKEKDGVLTIAIDDPLDIKRLDEIKLTLKQPINPVISSLEDIMAAIREYYGVGAETVEEMLVGGGGIEIKEAFVPERKDEYIQDETIDPSVIKFVNQVMIEAIDGRATDIHIEPFEDELRIRHRIDGVLYKMVIPPTIKQFQSAIVSRVKIMSNLNIAEKRLPQDGRIKIRMENEEFDLRISILPTPFGESVSIRILSRGSLFLGLEQLGLSGEDSDKLNDMIKKPHGIILVTGPTGSGKTTTLYASLSKLNSMDRKIITIEDPIEYQLKGITQIQVLPKIGLTFANGLRSMLRHDPDIMMVGEIRDVETAEITIRTALTGHLVFSTLHTNDAAGAIARLLDMGIEPYLVSSSVEGIIAQRLVRIICPACKEEYVPPQEVIINFGVTNNAKGVKLFRGRGCAECKYTGYKGRTGVYEILVLSDEIRNLISSKVPANIIKRTALSMGMRTLREDGWQKMLKGITTIEEVLRVSQEDTYLES